MAHDKSAEDHNMWIGVAPGVRNRVAYTEFITAQIKVGIIIHRMPSG